MNIWVAAADGNLNRVQSLIQQQSLSPNIPDHNTYTPMHAAASYGRIEILDYLVSQGGDVNITDSDGDTPLYTVENIETARWLVEHGAQVDRTNNDGISPIEHLSEEFPTVAAYLQTHSTLSPTPQSHPTAEAIQSNPSEHAQNTASEALTNDLLTTIQDILERAEAEGRDPDEEIRRVVGNTVFGGVLTGYGMALESENGGREEGLGRRSHRDGDGRNDGEPTKRSRTDDSGE